MANVNDMGMKELVEAIESGTLTKKEEKQALQRLDELSTDYGSEPEAGKDIPKPKPRPTMQERGFQEAAYGGMIHRGRRAGNSAEKAR